MAEKLKLLLQSQWQEHRNRLSLFLKAAIFAAGLFLIAQSGFGVAAIVVFILVSVALYSRPLFENYSTFYAFLVLLPAAILGMRILERSILFWPGILLFSFIFYLLVGIKNLLFIKRSRLYYVAALLLFYAVFIEFFLVDKSDWFLLKYGAVILAAFLLFREWLTIISAFSFPKRELLAAGVAAFLVAQLLWAVALLPIGFISSANLMLLLVFVPADFLLKHFTGGISREFLIPHLVFFLALSALIFWSSNWGLTLN